MQLILANDRRGEPPSAPKRAQRRQYRAVPGLNVRQLCQNS
jgi:hypothetical protein